jgi:signal transduction histidine kinase
MVLFGLSVSGLLGFVWWETAGLIRRQTDATIEAEITGLAEEYAQRGMPGLALIISDRSRRNPGRGSMYMLADPYLTPVAGNLSGWPEEARGPPGWIDLTIRAEGGEAGEVRTQLARARTFTLTGGFHLLVGRDMTESERFRRSIVEALLGALALTVLLGLLGGWLISRDLLRRIDAINRGARAILAGDMRQRMPVTGAGDEFDQLAGSLNAMLDRIDRLMAGMRGVADDIAHDLRSPISRLRSRLEVALLGTPEPTALTRTLQETITEADGILATFNAVLGIALAESGALRADFERVDLGALARDAGELYEPLAEEKGLALTVDAAGGVEIAGHRHLLSQAVANLLDNAVKYTPAGGRIRLTVTAPAGAAELVVADTGPGIPPDFRERALERFTRGEASRHQPGSGLGLSLVAAVANLHGATLTLEDAGPGLRVRLAFPR